MMACDERDAGTLEPVGREWFEGKTFPDGSIAIAGAAALVPHSGQRMGVARRTCGGPARLVRPAASTRKLLGPAGEAAGEAEDFDTDDLVVGAQVHDQARLDFFRLDVLPRRMRRYAASLSRSYSNLMDLCLLIVYVSTADRKPR
jgi:hypothetical protein